MMFSRLVQQQPTSNGTDFTWAVLIALLTVAVNVISLVVMWRKDVLKQRLEDEQAEEAEDNTLIDQYQEELKQCREDRVAFRQERAEWEKERRDLMSRIRVLESEKSDMEAKVYQLSLTNKRHELEIADLRKRLQSALEN